ncbi:MAG: DNA mismatch repair protein MutS, partial [Verrucomicrobiota bacterium]
WTFAPETAFYTVKEQFKVASLDGFGLKEKTAAIGAAGGALHYLTQNLRRDVKHLTRISFYQRSDFLTLDYTTLRHLEILEPQHHDAPRNASLYGALNKTVTPMGARLLRNWLSQPLAKVEPIQQRQNAVETFINNSFGLDAFRQQLAKVRDLERTLGRISSGSGNARDLVALRTALEQIPALKQTLETVGQSCRSALIAELNTQISESPDLVELISRAIVDEPPLSIKEGGMIRDGFDAALDELRTAQRGGKDWIAKLQADEITATGISSLKVRFNSVFGYYIEVTKSNLDKVPPHYHRKQTVANGERFITPELKDMEGKILGAEERSVKLEYEIFQRVREEVLGQLPKIQQSASALAQLDVLGSFAETARLHNYCRPHVANDGVLQIRDGRHPVLEQQLVEERFVPNDTALGIANCQLPIASATVAPDKLEIENRKLEMPQIALITGPNMAGKSTYIRQVALLTLLAHTGSFVPATEARIDLVDRIFTRIGASDDLSRGQSTFMVEMTETANILNNA